MRGLIVMPLALLVAAAIGYYACQLARLDPHPRGMISAGIVTLFAGILAVVPTLLLRGHTPATVAQAGLAGSVIHLLLSIAIAAVVCLAGVGSQQAFLLWMIGFYWVSLVVLVGVVIRQIKAASARGPAIRHSTT